MTYKQFKRFVKAHRSKLESYLGPCATGQKAVEFIHCDMMAVASLLEAGAIPREFVTRLRNKEVAEADPDELVGHAYDFIRTNTN